MEFKDFLAEQLTLHPSAQPQDVVKQCYQAAYGAEHLLEDLTAAEACFAQEYAAADGPDAPLLERISPEVCRVRLSAWKRGGLPSEWLFRLFVLSAEPARDGGARFSRCLSDAEALIGAGGAGFPLSAWRAYLDGYQAGGMGPVHHSAPYRAQEAPCYRVVSSRLARLLPVLQRIATAPRRRTPFVLALDGRSASGKTTAAEALGRILDAGVVHMDDFFLPPALRTPERLAQPGGNVHYERFSDEVLSQLPTGRPFSYRLFDCGRMDYAGLRTVPAGPFCIVEGSYSCHPFFGAYADLRVFADVEPGEQLARIRRRNGAEQAVQFRTRWIPMEEQYFSAYGIRESAEIIL